MTRKPTEMELRVATSLRDLAYRNTSKAVREKHAPAHEFLDEARAAIRAMREPTAPMIERGELEAMSCADDPCGKLPKHVFGGMIDAASPPEAS
jgi:hypothetical protein